jgi:hypothetical protein
MPIKGLTDANTAVRTLGRLGVIRKGEMLPDGKLIDLDYFRFVPKKGPYEEELRAIWDKHFGEKPVKIEVYFLKPTVEENWSTWMESWGKTGLKFRCNGEHWVQWLDPKTLKPIRDYDLQQMKVCPYCSGDTERTKEDPGDKAVGYLEVMLMEFLNAGFAGSITVHTTSINDLGTISGQLYATYDVAAQYGQSLSGIPFDLMRVPRTIQSRYQRDDGEFAKRPTEKSMLKITPSPRWVNLNIQQARQIAMKTQAALPIPTPALEQDDDLSIPVGQVIDSEPSLPPEPDLPPEPELPDRKIAEEKPKAEVREPMSPVEVLGRIQDHVERMRGKDYKFSNQKMRDGKIWTVSSNFANILPDEEEQKIALMFLTGEDSYDLLDDPQIEVLRKFLKVRKNDEDEWVPDPASVTELETIAAHCKFVPEEEPEEKEEPLFEDSEAMDYQEKLAYCQKLFRAAKHFQIDVPSFTDETMDEFIAIAEGLLKK